MTTIDFKHFCIFTDITQTEKGLLNLVGECGTGVFRDPLAIAMTEPEEM